MKIPEGWWKLDNGCYLQHGTSASVEYHYRYWPTRRIGWYAFIRRVSGTGEYVGVYPTAREAFKALGVEP